MLLTDPEINELKCTMLRIVEMLGTVHNKNAELLDEIKKKCKDTARLDLHANFWYLASQHVAARQLYQIKIVEEIMDESHIWALILEEEERQLFKKIFADTNKSLENYEVHIQKIIDANEEAKSSRATEE